jgi:hypothetical protein
VFVVDSLPVRGILVRGRAGPLDEVHPAATNGCTWLLRGMPAILSCVSTR